MPIGGNAIAARKADLRLPGKALRFREQRMAARIWSRAVDIIHFTFLIGITATIPERRPAQIRQIRHDERTTIFPWEHRKIKSNRAAIKAEGVKKCIGNKAVFGALVRAGCARSI